jgi:Insect cuticle protein
VGTNAQYFQSRGNLAAPIGYQFSYEVNDDKTGDVKYQKEYRDGDKVFGEYSLIEPDGYRRTVKYSVDKMTGFVADVQREANAGYKSVGFVPSLTSAASIGQQMRYYNDQRRTEKY